MHLGCLNLFSYIQKKCNLFILLELFQDRGNPDVTTKQFQNIPFNADLADDNSNYAMITTMNGVDGFVMDVDPLYKVCGNHVQSLPNLAPFFYED